jgi:hypothetical protein
MEIYAVKEEAGVLRERFVGAVEAQAWERDDQSC